MMGQKDEIVWLDSPNHRFSVKVAWEQLRRHRQMVEWQLFYPCLINTSILYLKSSLQLLFIYYL